MENGYEVELGGEATDLAEAAACFKTGDLVIQQRDDTFLLEWPDRLSMDDPAKTHRIAESLVQEVNVVLKFLSGGYKPITVRSVSWTASDGTRRGYMAAELKASIRIIGRAQATVVRAGETAPEQAPSLSEKALSMARVDPTIADVLRLWSSSALNGDLLFKIYELVRRDMGGENALVKAGLTTEANRSAFTGSINRRDVLGDFARHAVSTGAPPTRTMTVPEVKAFVHGLVANWIEHKHSTGIRNGRMKS